MNKSKFGLTLLVMTSLIFLVISVFFILDHSKSRAAAFGKCINDCPDGSKVTCNGARISTIDDPKDPGCICDKKEYRCSDKNKNSNTNTESNDKDKKKKRDKKDKKKKKKKKKEKKNDNTAPVSSQ